MPAMRKTCLLAPLALLAAGACTTPHQDVAYRGLETPHQPIVTPTGAYVPGCPDWSTAGGPATEGQSSNYGCATMSNLAAMVAEPGDLLHGRGTGLSGAEVSAKAIKTWRELPATSKLWVTTTSAATSSGAAPK
jgi:hypothetical protein